MRSKRKPLSHYRSIGLLNRAHQDSSCLTPAVEDTAENPMGSAKKRPFTSLCSLYDDPSYQQELDSYNDSAMYALEEDTCPLLQEQTSDDTPGRPSNPIVVDEDTDPTSYRPMYRPCKLSKSSSSSSSSSFSSSLSPLQPTLSFDEAPLTPYPTIALGRTPVTQQPMSERYSVADLDDCHLSPLSFDDCLDLDAEFTPLDCETEDPTLASAPAMSADSNLSGGDTLDALEIARILSLLGLHNHLVFAIQRQEAHMKTVIMRFATLMEWLIENQPSFKDCTAQTLQLFIKNFISEDYDLLSAYVQYLSQHKHYQPATVVAHIDDIRICVTWFVLFRTKDVHDQSRMKQPEMLGFLTSAKHLRKILNKKV